MPYVNFWLKGIRIQINLLILPVILAAIIGNFIAEYSITLGFIICHELGHIALAAICGAKLSSFRLLPVGVNASIEDLQCSKPQKIVIYLAGPLVNIVFAISLYWVHTWEIPICGSIIGKIMPAVIINLWLAIFNLIPVPPLDGGKIAMELLAGRLGFFRANRFMNTFSFFFSFMIICTGTVVLIRSRYNGSFILIGVYILFLLKKNKKEAAILNIKNIILKRSDIIRKGIIPVREIAVMKDVKLLELVKSMDYSNVFHIIKVLDNDLNVIKSVTEQDVLNALTEGSLDITVGEISINKN